MGILESKALALGEFPDGHYIRVSGKQRSAMNETNIQISNKYPIGDGIAITHWFLIRLSFWR
jgi:hypothetical protein